MESPYQDVRDLPQTLSNYYDASPKYADDESYQQSANALHAIIAKRESSPAYANNPVLSAADHYYDSEAAMKDPSSPLIAKLLRLLLVPGYQGAKYVAQSGIPGGASAMDAYAKAADMDPLSTASPPSGMQLKAGMSPIIQYLLGKNLTGKMGFPLPAR